MGNQMVCGCRTGKAHQAYGDSPYSKQMNKNMFRFWAEVFLLAEECASSVRAGSSGRRPTTSTKWQLMLPKLVPVNVARVQQSPTVVSHVTAYNTKTEKVLDVLVYSPGIELYRGSECFVYWTDPPRGLTWGLNFIRSEDADHFTDLVQRSTLHHSLPATPESRSGTTVKFSEHIAVADALPTSGSPTATPPPNPTQLFVTGHRLSHWSTMLQEQRTTPSSTNSTSTDEDDERDVQRRLSFDAGRTPRATRADSSQSIKSGPYDNLTLSASCQHFAALQRPGSVDGARTVLPRCAHTNGRKATLDAGGGPIKTETEDECSSSTTSKDGIAPPPPPADVPPVGWDLGRILPYKPKKGAFLLVKRWLAGESDGTLTVVEGEQWHHVWVRLKGFQLNLYKVGDAQQQKQQQLRTAACAPEQLSRGLPLSLCLSSCLVQPLPEHPRRENVFCFSTNSGDAYLFQAANETEVESWTSSIHTVAAMESSRSTSTDVTIKHVRKQLDRLEQQIEIAQKMVASTKSHQQQQQPPTSSNSSNEWDAESERLNVEYFVNRCYMAALLGAELPSCKKALSAAAPSSKQYLSQLGVFTMASLHAHLWCRDGGREGVMVHCQPHGQQGPIQIRLPTGQKTVVAVSKEDPVGRILAKACERFGVAESRYFILLRNFNNPRDFFVAPEDRPILQLTVHHTVELVEKRAYHVHLSKRGADGRLQPLGLTVRAIGLQQRVRAWVTAVEPASPAFRHGIVDGDELLAINGKPVLAHSYPPTVERMLHEEVDLCLILRTRRIQLPELLCPLPSTTTSQENLSECPEHPRRSTLVEVEVEPSPINQRQYTSSTTSVDPWARHLVHAASSSSSCGAGGIASDGGVRHRRAGCAQPSATAPPQVNFRLINNSSQDVGRTSQTCSNVLYSTPQHLPSQLQLRRAEAAIGGHRFSLPVVPSVQSLPSTLVGPNHDDAGVSPLRQHKPRCEQTPVDKSAARKRISASEPTTGGGGGSCLQLGRPLVNGFVGGKIDNAHKLERLIFEMIETERAYIQHLNCLLEQYLRPLADCRLLPQEEDGRLLLATTHAICRFQSTLLEELHEAAANDTVSTYPTDSQLRHALLRIGGVFLNRSHKFKVYSPYCVLHSKILKQLQQEEYVRLAKFLESRNEQNQHSTTFESYLIKPVQRVLRYPLFLHQIKVLTTDNTPEHLQISQALAKMEKMASYINEMQKVHEEYGQVFNRVQFANRLIFESKRLNVKPSELVMMGTVDWLNSESVLKTTPVTNSVKKQKQSATNHHQNQAVIIRSQCFVFKTLILLLYTEPEKPAKSKKKNHHSKDSAPPSGVGVGGGATNLSDWRHIVIPIHEVELNVSDAASTDDHFIWILIHMRQPIADIGADDVVYHFANRHREDKLEFLRAIRKAAGALTPSATLTSLSSSTAAVATSAATSHRDRHSISSPDSGFPLRSGRDDDEEDVDQSEPTCSLNGQSTTATSQSGIQSTKDIALKLTNLRENTEVTAVTAQRNSQTSSQSDCGYASNTERTAVAAVLT